MKFKIPLLVLILLCNCSLLMGQNNEWFQKGVKATDPRDQVKYFTKSIEKEGEDAATYTNRGAAYDDLKEYDKAIADFSKAIRIDSNSVLAYNNRGNAYNNLKQYGKAITDFSKSIGINPKYAAPWCNPWHCLSKTWTIR